MRGDKNHRLYPNWVWWFLLLPGLCLIVFMSVYPLLISLKLSFFKYNLIKPYLGQKFVGLSNFLTILDDEYFWDSLKVSIKFVGSSLFFQFVLGLGLALMVSGNFRGVQIFRPIFVVPIFVTPVVVGLIWRWMFNVEAGIFSYLVNFLGLTSPDWLSDPQWALSSVILVEVWQMTPFMFLVLLAGLMGIPNDLYEASKIDGANSIRTFWYITLPLLKPVIIVALMTRTIDLFKTFDKIYSLTGGGPGHQTQVLSLYVYKNSFEFFEMGYGSALSYSLVLVIACTCIGYIIWMTTSAKE